MDEKRTQSSMPPTSPARRTRNLATITILVILGFFIWQWHPMVVGPLATSPLGPFRGDAPIVWTNNMPPLSRGELVPLEVHSMSKCPDWRDALRLLILPAMQKISDKVDFQVTFIGTPTANDGVECKHGPDECMGNIIELCARELYPDPKISLGFIMCLSKDYSHIPERSLVEDCALEHAIDFQSLNECATRDDGAHGMEMLRDSVQRSADVDVTKSCTIRLNNKIYCIRDNYEWRSCPNGAGVNDLVIAIEKLYRS